MKRTICKGRTWWLGCVCPVLYENHSVFSLPSLQSWSGQRWLRRSMPFRHGAVMAPQIQQNKGHSNALICACVHLCVCVCVCVSSRIKVILRHWSWTRFECWLEPDDKCGFKKPQVPSSQPQLNKWASPSDLSWMRCCHLGSEQRSGTTWTLQGGTFLNQDNKE